MLLGLLPPLLSRRRLLAPLLLGLLLAPLLVGLLLAPLLLGLLLAPLLLRLLLAPLLLGLLLAPLLLGLLGLLRLLALLWLWRHGAPLGLRLLSPLGSRWLLSPAGFWCGGRFGLLPPWLLGLLPPLWLRLLTPRGGFSGRRLLGLLRRWLLPPLRCLRGSRPWVSRRGRLLGLRFWLGCRSRRLRHGLRVLCPLAAVPPPHLAGVTRILVPTRGRGSIGHG